MRAQTERSLSVSRIALLLGSLVLISGCKVETEIGVPCQMKRKATPEEKAAGSGDTVVLTNAELDTAQDFIFFGATECEELLCVRDVSAEDGAPGDIAKGYCSDECIPGAADQCEVTDDRVSSELKERMTCRNLVLDQDALNLLIQSDPVKWGPIFGSNRSSTFCAGSIIASTP